MIFPGICAITLLACVSAPAPSRAALNAIGSPLPAPPSSLLASEAAFSPFASAVAADVERLLHSVPSPRPESLKALLSLRVHLSLHFANDQRALEAADQIRAMKSDPGDRATTGLITRAIVGARESRRDIRPADLASTAGTLLGQFFSTLAHTAEMEAALKRSRARLAAITRSSLQRELSILTTSASRNDAICTVEFADRLVRYRHQLTLMLPLRDALIRAHDQTLSTFNHLP